MDHLAIPVSDQERSRRFYETYFGFGAQPARRYDDGVLMLYDAKGFALGLAEERIAPPPGCTSASGCAIARPSARCATASLRTA
jgi:catechol 2,3-dioxygenase-like lactoylglutathione lyase family enzyme